MPTSLEIVKRFYPNVTSVQDAKRAVKIEVTRADTNNKMVKNHKECALAIACKRKGADAAIICVKTAYLITGSKAIRYLLPGTVSREITSFDRNAGFEPGEYHLCSVPPSSTMGIKRKPKKHTGTGKPIYFHRTENIRKISEVL